MTERQLWAKKRNWIIFRLRGVLALFSWDTVEFMRDLVSAEDWYRISQAQNDIKFILNKVTDSKYKE